MHEVEKVGIEIETSGRVFPSDSTPVPKYMSWVQKQVKSTFEGILLEHTMEGSKLGTMFVHPDHKLESLHSLLHKGRHSDQKDSKKIADLTVEVKDLKAKCNLEKDFSETLFKVCKKLHKDHLYHQCMKNWKVYTENPGRVVDIDLDTMIEDVDPVIWNVLVLLTLSKSEFNDPGLCNQIDWSKHSKSFITKGTVHENRRLTKLLFLANSHLN